MKSKLIELLLVSKLVDAEDVLDSLNKYDDRVLTIDQKQFVDAKELLQVQNPGGVFVSKGVAISNHISNTSLILDQINNVTEKINDMRTIAPNNPNVKKVDTLLTQVKNKLSSVCDIRGQEKRIAVLTIILLSAAFGALFGTAAAVITLAATGNFEDNELTKEAIALAQEDAEKERDFEDFIRGRITNLTRRADSAEDRLIIQEQSSLVEQALVRILDHLCIIFNVENYNFRSNIFLHHMEQRLVTNENFTQLFVGNLFGLSSITTLLSLSESKSFILAGPNGGHDCEDSGVLVQLQTTIPEDKLEGFPTVSSWRYFLDEERSLYLNPKSFMKDSSFRPSHKFSTQRAIIGRNDAISMIRPFNNSLLFITTVGGFFIQKTCGSYSERIEVFRNPVLKIPLHCTIESPELNITKFETIYTLYNYEPVDELHTIDSEDFYPIYQHPDNEADIADDEMATKINELFNLHMRQTTNQRKQYENRDLQSRVKDTVNNGVDHVWGWVNTAIDSVIVDPISKIATIISVVALVLLLLIVVGYCVLKKKCSKLPV